MEVVPYPRTAKPRRSKAWLGRVGTALPFTLWPTLVAIDQQGMYSSGRHQVSALVAVAGPAMIFAEVLTVLAVFLILVGFEKVESRVWVIVAVLANCVALHVFINQNSFTLV